MTAVDAAGFGDVVVVDAGSLAEGGRKHQPGGPLFPAELTSRELRARLAA